MRARSWLAMSKVTPTSLNRRKIRMTSSDRSGSRLPVGSSAISSFGLLTIALVPSERGELALRVERRFDAMVEAGFEAEVERLKARGDLSPDAPSMRSVGYRQIWAYLDEHYEWPEARRQAIVATRRLAKRQMTWLRSDPVCERLAAFSPGLAERLSERIAGYADQRS